MEESKVNLGPYSDVLHIDKSLIQTILQKNDIDRNYLYITNGCLLELNSYVSSQSEILYVLSVLLGDTSITDINSGNFYKHVSKLKKQYASLRKKHTKMNQLLMNYV